MTDAVLTAAAESPHAPTPSGLRLSRLRGQAHGVIDGLKDLTVRADLTRRVTNASSAAGRRVAEAAQDPSVRAAVTSGITPTIDAALKGATVTNRDGEISKLRVLRAATRPRKTLAGAVSGATQPGAGQLFELFDPVAASLAKGTPATPVAALSRPPAAVWTVAGVVVDWPMLADPSVSAVLAEGCRRAADGHTVGREQRRAVATMLCESMARCLVQPPVIDGDLVVGIARVLEISHDPADLTSSNWEDDRNLGPASCS